MNTCLPHNLLSTSKVGALLLLLCLVFNTASAGDFFKKDKIVFDIYSPNWVNTSYDVKTDFDKSIGFAFTWGRDNQIKKSEFSYYFGLGYDYNKVSHNARLELPVNLEGHPTDFKWYGTNNSYDFNKVKLHYVDLPLELRYRTQTKIPFRLYLGVKVGYLFSSKYETQAINGEGYERKKIKELEPFRYGLTFRVGYGLFNFYSYYGLNPMLTPKAGGGMNQFALGISFLAN